MKTSISLFIVPGRYVVKDFLPRVAAAGFDGLDFNHCDFIERPEWREESSARAELEALARAAQAAGLEWFLAHAHFRDQSMDLSDDEGYRQRIRRAIRDCGSMGAPWTVVHPFSYDGPWDRSHREELLRKNVELFRSLLPDCEEAGTGLAIENVFDPDAPRARFFGGLPEDLCDLVDALDHPLVGVCWDSGHANLLPLDQRGAIAALGERVKAVHLHDNDGSADHHLLPFAAGPKSMDWEAVTAGLAEAGYEGAINIEAPTSYWALPEELMDEGLRLGAATARYLAGRVEAER